MSQSATDHTNPHFAVGYVKNGLARLQETLQSDLPCKARLAEAQADIARMLRTLAEVRP